TPTPRILKVGETTMDSHTAMNFSGMVQNLPPSGPEVFGTRYPERRAWRGFNSVWRSAIALFACALFWPFSVFQARSQPKSTNHQVTIVRQAGRVRITFTGALQAAAVTTGPWIEITNATSPWDEAATEGGKFYRAATTLPE